MPPNSSEHWTDSRLVYEAYRLGIFLTPFLQRVEKLSHEFGLVYMRYSGILVGTSPRGPHGIAKVGQCVIDPYDGLTYSHHGEPYQNLKERIFYAWMNQPMR